ncbi:MULTISPECIES: FAD-dependent monooxygenase [unclassified Nocardia]|uniref:FAD-dependent oxidoreductase n=1 Tax=unclassified Nocardia TaxID=2637762 RepID=UPI001CE4341A|nr:MULTISPECIES: FAD-dependent monooxygenase [unclassified Nocardia]
MTRALIIGGGIAGTGTAMALQQAGIDSVVYEAYPRGADDVGSFLTVFANGMDALRAIDAHRPVLENSFPAEQTDAFDSAGRPAGQGSLGGRRGIGPRTLTRAQLYRVLRDEGTRRGLRIEYGKRLIGAENAPGGGVIAHFEDGSQAEGDLLIGADGVHSTVRRIIDPAASEACYGGTIVISGYAENAPVPPAPQTYRVTYGSRIMFAYTTTPDGETWWFTNVPESRTDNLEFDNAERWKNRVADLLSGDNTPVIDLIRSTERIFAVPAYHLPALPVWYTPTMVLVGDSAHAAKPQAGHGASMALEDSVTLAKCLRDVATIEDAFATYDRLRRARVARVSATSARMSKFATPAGALTRIFRDVVILRLAKPRNRNADGWLIDHHIDWSAPITDGHPV